IPQIREGKVKIYGVPAPTRVAAPPDIPTIPEAGLPGLGARRRFSVGARPRTPQPIVDRPNAILTDYLQRPDCSDKLQALAIDPLTSTPDELEALIPAEIAKWAQVVKDAGIVPE